MTKPLQSRCPRCGREYPAELQFCKHDGQALVAKRSRRLFYVAAAMVMAVVFVLAAIIVGLPDYVKKHVSFAVSRTAFQTQQTDLNPEIQIRISNSSPISARLLSVTATCTAAGSNLGNVHWQAPNGKPLPIPANGSTELTAQLSVNVLGLLQSIASSGDLECKGPIEFEVFGLNAIRQAAYSVKL